MHEMYSGYDDEETDILRPIEYVQESNSESPFLVSYLVFDVFYFLSRGARW